MTKIIFIEGVSGVGKSTLTKALQIRLQARGYTVRGFVEFDFTNPIDFYCTACIPGKRWEELCQKYPDQRAQIKRYSIPAVAATLVRYMDGDTPLFPPELLAKMHEMEFCYVPPHPVPLAVYIRSYGATKEQAAANMTSMF